MLRVAVAAGLFFLGVVVGVASVAVHATWWGLPLAVVATAATACATHAGWSARLPYALGWAAMVAVLAVPRREGDFLIAADLQGYALVGLGLVLVVAGFVTLPRPSEDAPPLGPTS